VRHRDHLTVYVGDNGPMGDCVGHLDSQPLVQSMFMAMIKVGYFGRSAEPRGEGGGGGSGGDGAGGKSHPHPHGWRSGVDIMMPMFNDFHERVSPRGWAQHVAAGVAKRRADLYFRGNFGTGVRLEGGAAGGENYDTRAHLVPLLPARTCPQSPATSGSPSSRGCTVLSPY